MVALVYTQQRLGFQSDRNDLLSPDLPWNKRYVAYRARFEAHDRVVVAVLVPEGEGGRSKAEAFVNDLGVRLKGDEQHIRNVWWQTDAEEGSPALIRMLPRGEFDLHVGGVYRSTTLLKARGPSDFLSGMTADLTGNQQEGDAAQAAEQISRITSLVRQMRGVLSGQATALSTTDADSAVQYLASDDGRLLLLDIEILRQESQMDPHQAAVTAIRRALGEVRHLHPSIEAGLAGIPVMEVDETEVSQADATLSTAIAAVLILVMMVVAYHSFSLPLLSQAALGVGLAWSYGYLTFAIGHLQVVSIVFTVILLGLGIDFGIHVISQFELVRHKHAPDLKGFAPSLVEAMERAGPGMVTGALTTSVAFATTMATDFLGMAEMGHIAAVGVLLCLVSSLTVLPALMRLTRPLGRHIAATDNRLIDMNAQGWLMPFGRHPWLTLVATVALAIPSAWAMTQVRFDNNLMSLLPTGLESTVWQQRIMDHSRQALWYAAVITEDPLEARDLSQRLRSLASVESVGGAGLLFPEDWPEKQAILEQASKQLQPEIAPSDRGEVPRDSAGDLRKELGKLQTILPIALGRGEVKSEPIIHRSLEGLLEEVRMTADHLDGERSGERAMDALNRAFLELREKTRGQIAQALTTRELSKDDLPPILRREALSLAEPLAYQIKIFPRHDIWDPVELERFLSEVRGVDPNVTGSPVQIHESGLLMKESYRKAGLLALVAMLVIVFLDFRSVSDTLLSMMPVGLGFLFMFGVMWLTGEAINPANVMVLPLMFGISVDNGVHILHRYRQHPDHRPLGLSHGTGKGITLTSLTAVIGFSSLMLAQHRGIRSLGFVLAIGMTMTLAASLLVMPALLEIRGRIKTRRGSEPLAAASGLTRSGKGS